MQLPYFLIPELSRRLGRRMSEEDLTSILHTLGLNPDEPDLEPNVEGLVERYAGRCEIGSFVLPAELDFLGHQVPVHFKISWAGRITIGDPEAFIERAPSIRVEMLTWTEENPSRPQWSPIGPGILSDDMMDELHEGVVFQAQKHSKR